MQINSNFLPKTIKRTPFHGTLSQSRNQVAPAGVGAVQAGPGPPAIVIVGDVFSDAWADIRDLRSTWVTTSVWRFSTWRVRRPLTLPGRRICSALPTFGVWFIRIQRKWHAFRWTGVQIHTFFPVWHMGWDSFIVLSWNNYIWLSISRKGT